MKAAVGGLAPLIDAQSKDPDALVLRYLASDEAKQEKMLENPKLIKTPVVRDGKRVTVGYCPEIWKQWIDAEK